ncbi:PIG-L family deacetylase [Candidatus Woesearchaeota archaeon]|nr:PIG-L family deacetylase [Candidatus Woesearchaeota archaeon]
MGPKTKKQKEKEVILVICAHNDDHILGAGGTIAKYIKEGKDVIVVIFSYGETSHMWLKRKEAVKMRVKESHRADKIFGVNKTYYYGLAEGKFEEEFEKRDLNKRLNALIKILRPIKIFTHSLDDPHPDHRAVYNILNRTMDRTNYRCDVYSFDIWNPFNIRKRNSPKLVVDITDTYKLKIRAFSLHKSQWMTKIIMMPLTYIRAFANGLNSEVKYAEVFYKLR